MKKTVYLDTTIPSYLFDERESIRAWVDITKRWWAEERQRFDLWMSGETAAELRNGNYPRKQEVLAFVSEIPILPLETAIIDTAETYLEHYLMPQKLEGDALHLAYASYYKMDFFARSQRPRWERSPPSSAWQPSPRKNRMTYCPTSGHKQKKNMSAIVKEVYDAFVEAGVSEEKSTLAAKAIADYDNRFSRIESRSFPMSSLGTHFAKLCLAVWLVRVEPRYQFMGTKARDG